MVFTVICGVVLIIFAGLFMVITDNKKGVILKQVKPREEQPVIVELLPKGTKGKPYRCKVNSEVGLEVRGYTDYKKQNGVKLNDEHITYHKLGAEGKFSSSKGVKNIYFTPSKPALYDVWIKYADGKLFTTSMSRYLVED